MEKEKKVKKPIYKRPWFIVLCVLVIIGAIGSMGNKDKPAEPASTTAVSEPAQSASQPSESTASQSETPASLPESSGESAPPEDVIQWQKAGMYKVGSDIPAGEYYVEASSMGYIAVSNDSTGNLDSIITNENFSTFLFIAVEDGQYLEVTGAKFAPSAEIEPITSRGAGMYRVGVDLPAGEYKVRSTGSMGYLAVCKDSSGVLDSIITNDNFDGEKYITVSDGQYLSLTGAEIIE